MRICPNCGYEGDARTCPNDAFPTVDEERLSERRAAPDIVGKVFEGRYEVQELVGGGATAWVYKAVHASMRHPIALKILRSEMCDDLMSIKRFYQEARASSQLKHPNAIHVYDFGESEDGYLYMAMEFLEGQSLGDVVRSEGPLRMLRATRIVRQLLEALDQAHELGLVHRDVKPDNIFLEDVHGREDYVKILDFGMSKYVEGTEVGGQENVTMTGWIVGSPGYIAPEQARGREIDRRADLYAVGVTLYELVSGHLPFSGGSTDSLLVRHITERPPPLPEEVLGEPIPDALSAFVERMMSKQPDNRPATAAQALTELDPIIVHLAERAGETSIELGGVKSGQSISHETIARLSSSMRRRDAGGRRTLLLGAGILVLLGVVLGLLNVRQSGEAARDGAGGVERDGAGRTQPSAAEEVRKPAGTADETEAAADEAAEKAEPETPAPVTRKIELTSEPEAALVREDGKLIGETPIEVELAGGETRALTLEKRGYRDAEVKLDDTSGPKVEERLEKVHRPDQPRQRHKKHKSKDEDVDIKLL